MSLEGELSEAQLLELLPNYGIHIDMSMSDGMSFIGHHVSGEPVSISRSDTGFYDTSYLDSLIEHFQGM